MSTFLKFCRLSLTVCLVALLIAACKHRRNANNVRSIEGLQTSQMDQETRICRPDNQDAATNTLATTDPIEALRSTFKAAPLSFQIRFSFPESFNLLEKDMVVQQCKSFWKKSIGYNSNNADAEENLKKEEGRGMFDSCWAFSSEKKQKPKIWLMSDPDKQKYIHRHAIFQMARAFSEGIIDKSMPRRIQELTASTTPLTVEQTNELNELPRKMKSFQKARFALAIAALKDLKELGETSDNKPLERYKEVFKTDVPEDLAKIPDVQNFILAQTTDAFYCNADTRAELVPGNPKSHFKRTTESFRFFSTFWNEAKP